MKPTKRSSQTKSSRPTRVKRNVWDDSEAVDEFMSRLKHPLKAEMETLRGIILGASSEITEGIKWNSPSFYCHEWFATCNVRDNDCILIVLHQGAKVKDNSTAGDRKS